MLVTDSIILQAKRRLIAGSGGAITADIEIDIAAQIQSALAALAQKTMRNDSKRGLLQQSYSVTLTSGVGNLLTTVGSVTGVADMLMEGIFWGLVVDGDGNLLCPLKNYSAFVRPQPSVFGYYCLRNERIYTRAKDESFTIPSEIQGVTGPLTVTASFEPATCEVVPNELGDDLIEALVNLVLTKMPETLAAKK